MVSFIHIADDKNELSILRNGIRLTKRRAGVCSVYAMPVLPNFTTTHQWARELKTKGAKTLICVQFKIPNEELVSVGTYNGEKLLMTAAEALGTVLKHTDPMGLEIIISRKITVNEITRTYPAPRNTGWRYYPAAKGKLPCTCTYCNRGRIRAQRLLREGVE